MYDPGLKRSRFDRLTTAKCPQTRQKRFDQILAMLENG